MEGQRLSGCCAAILCGGQSRRMGFDKALLLRGDDGRLLLSTLARELSEHFDEVILVTNERAKLAGVAELAGWRIVEDLKPRSGPVGAIYTALASLIGQPVFIMGCDMPVIDWAVIEKMKTVLDDELADVVVPRHGRNLEPLYSVYGPRARPVFQAALENGRLAVRDSYPHLKTVYLDLNQADITTELFKNINYLADVYQEGFHLMGLKKVKIKRYENGGFTAQDDLTVAERRLDIMVNGKLYLSVMATPQHLDYLALGLLFGEGAVKSAADVSSIVVSEDRSRVEVLLSGSEPPPPLEGLIRLSGFGAGISSTPALTPPVSQGGPDGPVGPLITAETICELMEDFNQSSGLFRATGAVHSVGFMAPGQREADIVYDDIGRHNALDKVIGRLLLAGLEASSGLILTTGRISVEILLKVHRAGIKMLISRSAPTDRAVSLAQELNMTLIGFARGGRFNIYSGPGRIADISDEEAL